MITKKGPIILIDDDIDDQEITSQVITELGVKNQIICFSSCNEALDYLLENIQHTQPFIILCDVNLPRMNGIEFKRRIDENEILRKKSVPFVFFSTACTKDVLEQVYEYRVQGYFIKDSSIGEMKETLSLIFHYWSVCKHPNSR